MKIEKASKYKEGATGFVAHLSKEELVCTMALVSWTPKISNKLMWKYVVAWWDTGRSALGLNAQKTLDMIPSPYTKKSVIEIDPLWEPQWEYMTEVDNGNS